jgi:hypothetical protein
VEAWVSKHERSRETRTVVYPAGVMRPEDLLTFIHFNHFTAEWKRLGLTDDDLRALECCLMAAPSGPPVMRGTGGLRKVRFSPQKWHAGKSGGLRIGYAYIEEYSVIIGLIVVFAKKEQANLDMRERNEVKKLIERFREIVERGGYRAG